MYSEKATKFCEISTLLLSVCKVCIIRLVHIFKKDLRRLFDKYAVARTEHDALVKSTTKILSNFVTFSENPNFTVDKIV